MTIINETVFAGCLLLKSVVLPHQLRIIQASAFSWCKSLESLTIPASVKHIYQNAFANCTSLKSVTALPTTPPFLYDNSFPDYTIPLNVPSGCKDTYQNAQGWNNFKTINDGNIYHQMSIKSEGHGKVTYGTADVVNDQNTFDVKEGSDAVLTLTPSDGYKVDKVTVNGSDRTADVVNGTLTLSKLSGTTTVVVTFAVAGEFARVVIGGERIVTFCPPADADFTTLTLKAYTGGGFNRQTGVLTMMRVYDVPAGTGLVLKGEPGTYFVPYSQSYSVYSNLLRGVAEATTVSPAEDGYVNYVLGSGSQGVGFYKVGIGGVSLEAGKAYLQIPAETAAGSRSSLTLRFDDEETEVTGIDDCRQSADGAVYDLQGRKVAAPKKGLYIRNGRKVAVK